MQLSNFSSVLTFIYCLYCFETEPSPVQAGLQCQRLCSPNDLVFLSCCLLPELGLQACTLKTGSSIFFFFLPLCCRFAACWYVFPVSTAMLLLLAVLFWDKAFLCIPRWSGTFFVAQAGFVLSLLLPLSPQCWVYRHSHYSHLQAALRFVCFVSTVKQEWLG